MPKKQATGAAFYEGGSWYHRIKTLDSDGKTNYSKRGGFASKEEAEKSYLKYEETFKKDCRKYQMSTKVNREISLKDYLIYWHEEVFSGRAENSSRMISAFTLYDLILPNIQQDIKLRLVNTEYLDALLEVVSKSCESAGNKGRSFLYMAFKEAEIEGYITKNPCIGTKPYPQKKATITILNKNNIKKFLNAASKGNWYLEILLGLFLGLRKGEIYGLKFQDFSKEQGTIYIQRQITSNPIVPKGSSKVEDYKVIEKEPKTDNSYRCLKVPAIITEELEKRRLLVEANKEKYGENYYNHDYVSCQENGFPHSVSAMNIALTKLCSRNGLPHLSVHSLRHMFATILIEQGVPLIKISALLGHSSVTTSFEYYCDVMNENEQIIDFMNDAFVPGGSNTA